MTIHIAPTLSVRKKMKIIKPADLEELVYHSCKKTFSDLVRLYPDETFYTFGLFTDDSLQFLYPVANSEEQLIATVKHYNEEVDPKYNSGPSTSASMRWSYGDWGYFPPNIDDKHFRSINASLSEIFDLDVSIDRFSEIVDDLWDPIIRGLCRLDSEGFFRSIRARKKITLLIVGDLPEDLTDDCVTRLNPLDVSDAFINWNYEV